MEDKEVETAKLQPNSAVNLSKDEYFRVRWNYDVSFRFH